MRAVLKCLTLILLVILLSGLYVLKHMYWFNMELLDGVVIKQEIFTNKYHLIDQEGELLVSNVAGWIIDRDAIYGTVNGSALFFITNTKNIPKANIYNTSRELNQYLKTASYGMYDFKYEENIAHLKFWHGKKRKYPIQSVHNH